MCEPITIWNAADSISGRTAGFFNGIDRDHVAELLERLSHWLSTLTDRRASTREV